MAARFWVGGTGAWDNADTSHWSTTSGGGSGAAVPTSADDVTFDANSGASATVTIQTATANANSITINKVDLTLTHVGFGSTVVGTLTLTTGTLNTNGQTCNWGNFTFIGVATRTLTLGSSTITVLGGTNGWWANGSIGITVTPNTAIVNATTVNLSGLNMQGTSFVLNSGAYNLLNGFTCANLTVTGLANKTGAVVVSANFTVTGTFTIGGNSTQGVNRLLVQSNTVGTQRTITAAAYVITGDVDFMDINLAYSGGASWTNTGNAYIGDALGNAGAVTTNATTPAIQTATGTASFTWSTHGWTSRVPLPQDNVVINNAFVAGRIITADMPRLGAGVNFTGCTGNPTFTNSIAQSIFGSLTLVTGVTLSGANVLTLAGRSSYSVVSAGATFTQSVVVVAPGGVYSFTDDFITALTLQLTNGTLTASNVNMTMQVFNSNFQRSQILNMGTGNWTLTQTTATTVWLVDGTVMTLNASTSTIILSVASANTRTFDGGGKTYGTLTYTVANSPGALTITGANTFSTLNIGSGRLLTMPSATTNTATNFSVNGTSNGYMYLPSAAGNYANTPDSAAVSVTGDIEIQVRIAPSTWTPAANGRLVSKRADGTHLSYDFYLGTTGFLGLITTSDGSTQRSYGSSVATNPGANVAQWVRVTRSASTGNVDFYTAADGASVPSSWTALGSTQSLTAEGIYDGTQMLEVGSTQSGTSGGAAGKYYRARVLNGIAGTVVFDADFTTKPVGANSFTEGSSNAATVTINGVFAQAGDGRIIAVSSTPGSKWAVNTAVASASYVDVTDSSAVGAGIPIWNTTGVDRGNNTGWIFVASSHGPALLTMGTG